MTLLETVVDIRNRWTSETTVGTRVSETARGIRRDGLLLHGLLFFAVFLLVLPVLLGAIASTHRIGIMTEFSDLIPGQYAAHNYYEALIGSGFWRYLLNSFIMSIVIVVGKLLLSMLAVLAIVYYQVPYKDLIFLFILFTLMLPVPVRFVPLYDLIVNLGWTNSFLAITIPYLASATTVFILRQHFLTIPPSVVETARIDGVGPIKFLFYVLIPMSKGVLIGVCVIMFVFAWNQYLWPLVVIDTSSRQVSQVGLALLEGDAMAGEVAWSLVMAGSMLTLIPPLLLLIAFRKPLLQTFTIQQK